MSRASRSRSPDVEAEQPMFDIFGPTFETPFARYDPATRYWRTYLGISRSDSPTFSLTLPPSGSMRNGRLSQQPTWVPPTSAAASSLLHTPTAKANQLAPSMAKWKGTWLPTPTATPYGSNQSLSPGAAVRPSLAGLIGGTPNPTWVEWLMGFPTQWTDCEPSATPSSRKSPSSSADG